MQRITRDRISYVFDRRLAPVLRVEPGETFLVETEDARSGRTRTPETMRPEFVKAMRTKGPYYGNPVTGPIHVEGAEPGDTLAVHIHEVRPDEMAFNYWWPHVYHQQDWFAEPVTRPVAIRDGHIYCELTTPKGVHSIRIPTQAMIGCIGTAPHLEAPTSGGSGRHGGNLDVPEIGADATVYLPVHAPGGLLFLGDCHPYQGDGELTGFEMRAEVTLSVKLVKGRPANAFGVRVETPKALIAVGSDRPAESAQWLAIREMIVWLEERFGWTKQNARDLLSMTSDVRPGQIQVQQYTMRVIVSKNYLPTV